MTGRKMSKPFEPVLSIRTTAANVADLKTEQHRWVCPCGERGPLPVHLRELRRRGALARTRRTHHDDHPADLGVG